MRELDGTGLSRKDAERIADVIGQRRRRSGMEWSVRGASAITALGSLRVSNRTEDCRVDRTA